MMLRKSSNQDRNQEDLGIFIDDLEAQYPHNSRVETFVAGMEVRREVSMESSGLMQLS